MEGHDQKKLFSEALRRIGALPPLLNSFRRHYSNHDFWRIAEGAWPLGRRWLRISNAAVANVRLSHQFHQQTSPTAAGVHDEQCARELHRLTGYMLCADLCLNANRAELTNVEALFGKNLWGLPIGSKWRAKRLCSVNFFCYTSSKCQFLYTVMHTFD